MLFLGGEELRAAVLDELLARTDCVVAFGVGEVRGNAAAVLLFADYAVLDESATLTVDTPEAWAAAVWRLGRRAVQWAAGGAPADEIVDERSGRDPQAWRAEWMQHRSVMALDSAAALIRARGGDRLERAEFARLFAAGEPQKGLGAFLAKTRPTFTDI